MVLSEFADENEGFDFSILGTDLSTRVLERAVNGIYTMERIAPVSDAMRRKFLLRSKNRDEQLVRVVPDLRARMRFKRLNFMDDSYGLDESFQAIFCRNVIIYFDRPTQACIVGNICKHLVEDGYIFMGHSETLNGMGLPLKQVAPSVYQRIPEPREF
jgi:chemotaxis protein methyltransferase CheR